MSDSRDLVVQKVREYVFKDQDSGQYLIPRNALEQLSLREANILQEIIKEVAAARNLELWIEDDFIHQGVRIYWSPAQRAEITDV